MKRLVAAGLWLYAFWYLGSMIAAFLALPDFIGPALGLAVGTIIWTDPRHLIWHREVRLPSKAELPVREEPLAA